MAAKQESDERRGLLFMKIVLLSFQSIPFKLKFLPLGDSFYYKENISIVESKHNPLFLPSSFLTLLFQVEEHFPTQLEITLSFSFWP